MPLRLAGFITSTFEQSDWLKLLGIAGAWKQTYFVATPAGLRKMLRDSKLNFMFLPKVLIMDRYDAQELRTAVPEDLAAMEEERGDVPPDASDTAEDGN